MSSVLVTGAAGFIGSHVVEELVRMGAEIVAVDNLSGGFKENIPEAAVFREADVRDRQAVKRLFEDFHFGVVFHLASYAAENLSHHIKWFNYENNLLASVSLINESVNSGVERFVFASSIAVYGSSPPPVTEETVPAPEDPYGIAKYAVEMELAVTKEVFGLDYVIFRPHNVYGERQNIWDRYRNVVGIFMNQIMSGRPLTVFGDGMQKRAFTHVSDVAPVMARSAWDDSARNHTFNIGSDTAFTILGLIEELKDVWGLGEYPVAYLKARQETKEAWCDHRKAQELLGYRPRCELKAGLAAMAAWAKSVGPRQPSLFREIEIRQGLPGGWQ